MAPTPKKDKESGDSKDDDEDRSTDRELQIEKELQLLTTEAENSKLRVKQLKAEIDWLEDEAARVTNESQEYMNYMAKKTNLRQNTIITLSDQNKKELDDIKIKKEMMIRDFELKKSNLQNTLLEKQNLLNKLKIELENMADFKRLKMQQTDEIRTIETEMDKLRIEHSKAIGELKTRFLKEKGELKREADSKIQSVIKAANREAKECLNENTFKIKYENQKLRSELLNLIEYTKELYQHKVELDKQKNDILREISYAEDLKRLRSNQQEQVMKKMFKS